MYVNRFVRRFGRIPINDLSDKVDTLNVTFELSNICSLSNCTIISPIELDTTYRYILAMEEAAIPRKISTFAV